MAKDILSMNRLKTSINSFKENKNMELYDETSQIIIYIDELKIGNIGQLFKNYQYIIINTIITIGYRCF
ncbi:MAG: hypothetical protein E2590_03090 [Chryseobacterium sp.]|nr:hypothetical protein [Chryseobacterium sp.]